MSEISALWQSEYGRTLLLKLAFLSVVAGTGAYNWRRVKPTLGTAAATTALQRSARIEMLAGVLMIAVTAVLVATPTPMDLSR
jgi:putative copper export protein